jgi:hypothetical protein
MTSHVDVLKALGFEVVGTGGGCEALEFSRPDGQTMLITNDLCVPAAGEGWEIGIYADGDYAEANPPKEFKDFAADDLLAALAYVAAWRVG